MNIDYSYAGEELWYHSIFRKELVYLSAKLDTCKISYWLDWGTLLGALRNRKIIPWDYDIDLGIFCGDVSRLLCLIEGTKKDGYDIQIEADDNGCIEVVRFYLTNPGVFFHIDIFPWKIEGVNARLCYNGVIRPLEEIQTLSEIEFEGRMHPCPLFPEKAIERLYGENWREQKVYEGNIVWMKNHAKDNKDIKEEIKKYL